MDLGIVRAEDQQVNATPQMSFGLSCAGSCGRFPPGERPHALIEGEKAVELEDQGLVSLSRAVAVIGKVKMGLRKIQLRNDVLNIAMTEV